jgi:hypothetical protein
VGFLAQLDWHPPAPLGHLLTALTYMFSFALASVLVRFWSELLQGGGPPVKLPGSAATAGTVGGAFLYPVSYLARARRPLMRMQLLLGASTYVMLCVVHAATPLSPVVALVGALVHTMVYAALGAEAAVCAWQYAEGPAASARTTGALLAGGVAACLLGQGALTAMSVLATRVFFAHFAAWQTAFLASELAPALFLLFFLCERPTSHLHYVAVAA